MEQFLQTIGLYVDVLRSPMFGGWLSLMMIVNALLAIATAIVLWWVFSRMLGN